MLARLFSVFVLVVFAQMATAQGTLEARLTALGAQPCPDAPLLCLTLQMPLDHAAPSNGQTIDIRFGVHLATGGGQDVLFYATGGPGSSGIALSDGYLADLDPALTENLNIVFWEQRGTGGNHIILCPQAQSVFDLSDLPIDNPAQVITTVRAYVAGCQAELIDPGVLPYLSTDQAIRDLEVFRNIAGIAQVWLYGESYGTQFAQQYATVFGSALKGLVIAGVVRLDMTFEAYYANYTAAAEKILDRVFEGCAEIAECDANMQVPAQAAYAALEAQLAQGPELLQFPLPNGQTVTRPLTARMLALNAYYALYTPTARATFLRALALANEGDLLPMLRLAYDGLFIDSLTLQSVADQTQLPAAYFAILCSDFVEGGPNSDQNVRHILNEAQAFKTTAPRLDIVYYADRVVCAEWPVHGTAPTRPAFVGGSYPTFILTADTDPITTASMAYAVFDQVQNGYLVTQENGPHVIFGEGLPCPDVAVAQLLLRGQPPTVQEALCSRNLIGDYVPLPEDATPYLMLRSAVDAILSYPEFNSYSGDGTRQIGCNYGGEMILTQAAGTVDVTLTDCGLWSQNIFTGSLEYDVGNTAILRISAANPVQYDLAYRRDLVSGAETIVGTENGVAVETPRPLP
ncbi:MAG: alpha/beta hydrolase [Pseudomonadota bacterium]